MSSTTIIAELASLRAEVLGLKVALEASLLSPAKSAPVAAKSGKAPRAKKEKDPDAPKVERPPTAWRLFADRVRELLRSVKDAEGKNLYEGKALGPQLVQFAASLKEENDAFDSWTDADILARRVDWTPPEVSRGEQKGGPGWAKTGERRSKNGSVASGSVEEDADGAASAVEEPKKKRVISDEQKAKMAAGRAKKAAEKKAAKEAETAAVAAIKALGESGLRAVASAAKSNAAPPSPKAAAPKAPEPVAKSNAAGGGEPAAADVFKPVQWSDPAEKDAEGKPMRFRFFVNMATGHAYHRNEDGSQGEWAGIFHKNGGGANKKLPYVDVSVPDPNADEDEEELNFDAE